ncbi:MAG TPA: hypothetical protein VMB25_07185 [Bryobacteraceae bacterium]|nr:hypothetical protein [Bryobacteraceae bacterium]
MIRPPEGDSSYGIVAVLAPATSPRGGRAPIVPTFQYDLQPTFQYDSAQTIQYDSAPTFQYDSPPTFQYDSPPTFQYDSPPTFQYDSAPTFQYDSQPTFQYDSPPTFQYDSPPTLPDSSVAPVGTVFVLSSTPIAGQNCLLVTAGLDALTSALKVSDEISVTII